MILTAKRGIWALKWSFVGMMATALLQVVLFFYTHSVALLADTIHNFGDAFTAVPLWVAFLLSRKKPSARFSYGYGRVEDLAGMVIVLVIAASAVLAGYESLQRLFHPQVVTNLGWVVAASLIGFVGNEAVAMFRIKVGKEINSAALIADGQHARVDGLTSLAVLVGAIGVWLGFPMVDSLVGLVITLLIIHIAWDSAKEVFTRVLDGSDPKVIHEIKAAVGETPGVKDVTEVRVRWLGHRLHAELNVAVASHLTVEQGHKITKEVHHRLLHKLTYLSNATIHMDPANESGEKFH